jgi:hypothetical protein
VCSGVGDKGFTGTFTCECDWVYCSFWYGLTWREWTRLMVGSIGAALIPFAAGLLAQAKGVQSLMPLLVVLEVAMLGIWAFVPTKSRVD